MSGTVSDGPTDVLISPQRMMGGIIPDCVVEERGSDRLMITEHPVEQGATISDHAYKLPAEVTLRYAWSDSSGMSEGYAKATYDLVLNLQAARQPFQLVTGKRLYPQMLIASIDQSTDAATEYALMTTIVCKEIIIVTTKVTSIPAASSAQAPNVVPPSNQGTQTPKQVPSNSIPKGIAHAIQSALP